MELLKLLESEEKKEGCKIGYLIFCSRSGDWFWKKNFIDEDMNKPDTPDGMIKDLIHDSELSDEEIKELIEDKVLYRQSCCDTYYAVEVY